MGGEKQRARMGAVAFTSRPPDASAAPGCLPKDRRLHDRGGANISPQPPVGPNPSRQGLLCSGVSSIRCQSTVARNTSSAASGSDDHDSRPMLPTLSPSPQSRSPPPGHPSITAERVQLRTNRRKTSVRKLPSECTSAGFCAPGKAERFAPLTLVNGNERVSPSWEALEVVEEQPKKAAPKRGSSGWLKQPLVKEVSTLSQPQSKQKRPKISKALCGAFSFNAPSGKPAPSPRSTIMVSGVAAPRPMPKTSSEKNEASVPSSPKSRTQRPYPDSSRSSTPGGPKGVLTQHQSEKSRQCDEPPKCTSSNAPVFDLGEEHCIAVHSARPAAPFEHLHPTGISTTCTSSGLLPTEPWLVPFFFEEMSGRHCLIRAAVSHLSQLWLAQRSEWVRSHFMDCPLHRSRGDSQLNDEKMTSGSDSAGLSLPLTNENPAALPAKQPSATAAHPSPRKCHRLHHGAAVSVSEAALRVLGSESWLLGLMDLCGTWLLCGYLRPPVSPAATPPRLSTKESSSGLRVLQQSNFCRAVAIPQSVDSSSLIRPQSRKQPTARESLLSVSHPSSSVTMDHSLSCDRKDASLTPLRVSLPSAQRLHSEVTRSRTNASHSVRERVTPCGIDNFCTTARLRDRGEWNPSALESELLRFRQIVHVALLTSLQALHEVLVESFHTLMQEVFFGYDNSAVGSLQLPLSEVRSSKLTTNLSLWPESSSLSPVPATESRSICPTPPSLPPKRPAVSTVLACKSHACSERKVSGTSRLDDSTRRASLPTLPHSHPLATSLNGGPGTGPAEWFSALAHDPVGSTWCCVINDVKLAVGLASQSWLSSCVVEEARPLQRHCSPPDGANGARAVETDGRGSDSVLGISSCLASAKKKEGEGCSQAGSARITSHATPKGSQQPEADLIALCPSASTSGVERIRARWGVRFTRSLQAVGDAAANTSRWGDSSVAEEDGVQRAGECSLQVSHPGSSTFDSLNPLTRELNSSAIYQGRSATQVCVIEPEVTLQEDLGAVKNGGHVLLTFPRLEGHPGGGQGELGSLPLPVTADSAGVVPLEVTPSAGAAWALDSWYTSPPGTADLISAVEGCGDPPLFRLSSTEMFSDASSRPQHSITSSFWYFSLSTSNSRVPRSVSPGSPMPVFSPFSSTLGSAGRSVAHRSAIRHISVSPQSVGTWDDPVDGKQMLGRFSDSMRPLPHQSLNRSTASNPQDPISHDTHPLAVGPTAVTVMHTVTAHDTAAGEPQLLRGFQGLQSLRERVEEVVRMAERDLATRRGKVSPLLRSISFQVIQEKHIAFLNHIRDMQHVLLDLIEQSSRMALEELHRDSLGEVQRLMCGDVGGPMGANAAAAAEAKGGSLMAPALAPSNGPQAHYSGVPFTSVVRSAGETAPQPTQPTFVHDEESQGADSPRPGVRSPPEPSGKHVGGATHRTPVVGARGAALRQRKLDSVAAPAGSTLPAFRRRGGDAEAEGGAQPEQPPKEEAPAVVSLTSLSHDSTPFPAFSASLGSAAWLPSRPTRPSSTDKVTRDIPRGSARKLRRRYWGYASQIPSDQSSPTAFADGLSLLHSLIKQLRGKGATERREAVERTGERLGNVTPASPPDAHWEFAVRGAAASVDGDRMADTAASLSFSSHVTADTLSSDGGSGKERGRCVAFGAADGTRCMESNSTAMEEARSASSSLVKLAAIRRVFHEYTLPNGDTYCGYCSRTQRNGLGLYTYSDSQATYFGGWKNDVQNGDGILLNVQDAHLVLLFGTWYRGKLQSTTACFCADWTAQVV